MSATPDEEDLIAAAARGDGKAFMTLIQTHDAALRALAFSMTGNATLMDDVLQESYIKAFKSIVTFKRESSFKTWIYRIVHNTTIDELRRTARVTPIGPDAMAGTPHGSRSSEPDVALALDIEAALSRIPEAQREAVLLIDGDGFDYASAAEILGVPPGTVSSRLSQGRAALRPLLAPSYKGQS